MPGACATRAGSIVQQSVTLGGRLPSGAQAPGRWAGRLETGNPVLQEDVFRS
jgi:hypothetical protein